MTESRTKPQATDSRERSADTRRRICFVCTGNTCRSPMAAAVSNAMFFEGFSLLPRELREQIQPAAIAFSAGLYAADGEPISKGALDALTEAAILPAEENDYRTHRSHAITQEEAERYDLLIGLTARHAGELLFRFPHLADRILAFPQSVEDPYGGDAAAYRACLLQIQAGIRMLFGTEAES